MFLANDRQILQRRQVPPTATKLTAAGTVPVVFQL
jgi:hypothetical protein